jgi:hypothetical protein
MNETVNVKLQRSNSKLKNKRYRFNAEKLIKEAWDLRAEKWRLENDGIKLEAGSIQSLQKYVGDIELAVGFKGNFSLELFGEIFPAGRHDPGIARLVRKDGEGKRGKEKGTHLFFS